MGICVGMVVMYHLKMGRRSRHVEFRQKWPKPHLEPFLHPLGVLCVWWHIINVYVSVVTASHIVERAASPVDQVLGEQLALLVIKRPDVLCWCGRVWCFILGCKTCSLII